MMPSPGPGNRSDTAGARAVESLAQEARRRLRSFASGKAAAELRQRLGEQVSCHGVRAPEVGRIGQDLVRRVRTGGLAMALELGEALWQSGMLEERMLADQVVSAMARHVGGEEMKRFDSWVGSLDNEVNTDGLATRLVARSVAARPSFVARLLEWARSAHRWRRRAAVMALVPLVREGRFLSDALAVADRLMADADLKVQQGVGLLLMEASRLHPERVVEFLQAWRGKGSPTILQQATVRMSPAHRSAVLGSGAG